MADTNYNKEEFGQILFANLEQDISTATELTMIIEPMVGLKQEKVNADGVVLGTVNVDVNDETFIANEYITYAIKEDDLDFAGLWRNKGMAKLSSTNLVIGDYRRFSVLE